jgi:FkbM family methyltransferase
MELAKYCFETAGGPRDVFYREGTSDINILNQIFTSRDYDFPKKLRRADELIKGQTVLSAGRAPLIIDCGANFGASPVFFSCLVPRSHVVAIEPEKSNFDLLRMNTEGLSVECFQAAVASSAGKAKISDPSFRGNKASFRTEMVSDYAAESELIVPSLAINDLFEEYSENFFPYIVKIDIEGAESELFSKNTEWVDRTPLIIIELHDWLLTRQAVSQNFLRCISKLDRDFVYIGENVFSIKNDMMESPPEPPPFWG